MDISKSPEFKPINVEIQILDDYNFLLNDYDLLDLNDFNKISLKNSEQICDTISEQVKSGFGSYNDLAKGKLFIFINIQVLLDFSSLGLPNNFKLTKPPQIKKLSIEWPNLTSFKSFDLMQFSNNSTLPENTRYNPVNKSLEWFAKSDKNGKDIPMVINNLSIYRQNYEIKMLLGILQPGELYQQTNLKGEIEVEIPGLLLSELQARFYGFNNQKVGAINQAITQSKTRIITDFDMDINEAFKKRIRSTAQELVFNNILPTDENLRIIKNVLKSQGFSSDSQIITPLQIQNSNESNSQITVRKWLIYAKRSEGIETMTLWIVINGEKKKTLMTITHGKETVETATFEKLDQTGKLTMYLLGKLPRNSHTLMQRMNALQKELRRQLASVQEGPGTTM